MDEPNIIRPDGSPEPIQPPPIQSPNSTPDFNNPTIPAQPNAANAYPQVQTQVSPGPVPPPATATQHFVGQINTKNSLNPKLVLPLVLLIIVVLGIGAVFIFHGSPKPKNALTNKSTSATTTPSSTSVTQQNSDNTSRQEDAALIAAGVQTYIANNTGALPLSTTSISTHTVEFCGTTCGGDSTNTADLSYYDASAVSFKAYSSNMSVPTASTVYIVDNAACNNDNIGAQTNSSAAILFALQEGSSIKQQCQPS